MIKISCIIPTYKPANYLWECLDSLINQTLSYNDFEIVIVLNGVVDPYKDEILDYISKHNEFSFLFLTTTEAGVSNARNLGIIKSTGEYLTFIDDDDYVSPSYLSELLNLASSTTVSLCYPLMFEDGTKNFQTFRITKSYNTLCNKENVDVYQARKFFSGPVYKLIHRSIISNSRYTTKLSKGEDTLFMFLISNKIKNVTFTTTNAIYYRRLRLESATFKKRSIIGRVKSNLIEMFYMTSYYIKDPFNYNLKLYITRILGGLYDILASVMNVKERYK